MHVSHWNCLQCQALTTRWPPYISTESVGERCLTLNCEQMIISNVGFFFSTAVTNSLIAQDNQRVSNIENISSNPHKGLIRLLGGVLNVTVFVRLLYLQ